MQEGCQDDAPAVEEAFSRLTTKVVDNDGKILDISSKGLRIALMICDFRVPFLGRLPLTTYRPRAQTQKNLCTKGGKGRNIGCFINLTLN